MLNVALAHEELRGLSRAGEEALFSFLVQRRLASLRFRRHGNSMHRAGTAVNIVAVAGDRWQSAAWSTSAERDKVLARFPANG